MPIAPLFRLNKPTRRALPLALLVLVASCDKDETPATPAAAAPDTVAFTQANLYPEGVQYDAAGSRFLVSSQTTGAVGQVKDDGTYAVFTDNAALVSSIGMNLDTDGGRDRLLVAVSDPGYNPARTNAATTKGKLARLVVFNRSSPQTTPTVLELGTVGTAASYPAHFANDIAVDKDGNAYVTDSFAPIIYRVTPGGVVSVFAENAQFAAPAGAFGLNGIVYHPDGYLLVAKSNTGTLFKIPLATPATISTVDVGSQNLMAADGLRLADNNTLQVVCNSQAKVYRLATTNGWTSATVSGTFNTPPQYPTTLARRANSDGYVLYSNLNALQAMQTPPVSVFTIAKVKF
ncbi:SMP-30/gluconolactonase/LRE family protein [Hymenobacter agri]